MSTKTRKRISKGLAIAMVLTLLVGSFAYFTDRVETDAKVTAGTVGITEADTWTDNLLNADGERVLDNINPGDSRNLAFSVTNTGNKAVDVRHTIKISVVDKAGNAKELSMGADVAGEEMLQFDIFKASDVLKTSEENGNAGYDLVEGAKPVFSTVTKNETTQMGVERVYDAEKKIVTYYFADSILDGVGDQAEVGYASAEHIDTELAETDAALNGNSTVEYDYVLIFRDSTLNDFQGCTVYLDLVVEAKQHLNTKSSWQNIETVTMELATSEVAGQTTNYEYAPNNQQGALETDTADATPYNEHVPH